MIPFAPPLSSRIERGAARLGLLLKAGLPIALLISVASGAWAYHVRALNSQKYLLRTADAIMAALDKAKGAIEPDLSPEERVKRFTERAEDMEAAGRRPPEWGYRPSSDRRRFYEMLDEEYWEGIRCANDLLEAFPVHWADVVREIVISPASLVSRARMSEILDAAALFPSDMESCERKMSALAASKTDWRRRLWSLDSETHEAIKKVFSYASEFEINLARKRDALLKMAN